MRLLIVCVALLLSSAIAENPYGKEKPMPRFQLKGRSEPLKGEAPSATYCPTPTGTTVLNNGNSVCHSLPAGVSAYYMFNIPTGCPFLDITVTDITGDPDLYVSRTTTTPNQANYQWMDAGNAGAEIQLSGQASGPIYEGVYGFTDTIYLIIASCNANSSAAIVMKNGIPQNGRVPTGSWLYYHFSGYNFGDVQLRVDLGAKNGDPDLYITTDGSLPSPYNYAYKSIGFGGDYIEINAPLAGQYSIGVYGFIGSDYTLYVSSNTASTLLLDRVSYESYLSAGQFEYFQFPLIVTSSNPPPVQVVCTALSGDPDLYASRYTATPNPQDYEYASTRYGSDYMEIPATSTTWFLSVFGYEETGYALVYTTDNHEILTEGEMMFDELPANAMGRYYFDMGTDKTQLRFEVEAQDGATQLFISITGDPDPANPLSYQWATTNFSSFSSIEIVPADPQYCELCTYYICVKAWPNGTTDYTIVASTSDGAITLTRGMPVVGVFQPLETDYQYFLYTIAEQATTLNLAMTAVYPQGYAETPNMFVSTSALPNASYFTWRTVPNRPFIAIYGPPRTTYYIGVQGRGVNSVAYFTTTAYDDQSAVVDAVVLINSYPQNWIESTSSVWRYFSYTLDRTQPSLLFFLEQMGCGPNDACNYHGTCVDGFCACTPPASGSYCDNQTAPIPQLYVALNTVPSTSSYLVKGGATPNGQYSAKITSPQQGQYIIGVYSTIPNWYSIMAMWTYYPEDASSRTPLKEITKEDEGMAYREKELNQEEGMRYREKVSEEEQGMSYREIKSQSETKKIRHAKEGMANREKMPSPSRDSVHLHERMMKEKPF